MGKCVECGTNLSFLKGFCHPTLGKKNYVCSSCFDTISNSVEKYREFISPYVGFFNIKTSNKRLNINNISEKFTNTLIMHDGI
jgi:hypothetical protein